MVSYSIAIDTYTPAIPLLIKVLHTTQSKIQNTLNIFFLANALGGLFYGGLSDAIGRKKVLLFGAISFGITSLLLAQLQNVNEFLILRVLQGVGIAAQGSITGAILRDVFSGKDFAKASAFSSAIFMIAPTFAPTFGGILITYLGWRSIFYAMAIFSILTLALIIFIIPETLPKEKRTSLNIKSILINTKDVLKERDILACIVGSYLTSASFFVFLTDGSIIIIDIFHKTPLYFGYYFGFFAILIALSSLSTGILAKKMSLVKMMEYGFIVRNIGGIFLVLTSLFYPTLLMLTIGLAIFIIPGSFIMTASQTIVMDKYPHMAGTVSSILWFVGTVIMVGALAIISLLNIKSFYDMAMPMLITTTLGFAFYLIYRKKS